MLSTLTQEKNTLKDDFLVTKTVILSGTDHSKKRKEILNYFHNSFSLYESIFECLN